MSLNRLSYLILGSLSAVIIILAVAYWYVFLFLPAQNQSTNEIYQPASYYPVAHPKSVQGGHLFLTLRLGVGDFQVPTLFQLSTDQGMELRSKGLTAIGEKRSPNSIGSAFIAYPSPAFEQEFGTPRNIMQVMVSDSAGIIRPLTVSTSTPRKFAPSWSPDGTHIAFMASTSRQAIFAGKADIWDIFVTDLNGNEDRLTTGAYPLWSKDGDTLYVLKSNGIYSVDTLTGKEIALFQSAQDLHWGDSIAIDQSFRYLALIVPETGIITIFRIEGDKLLEIKQLPVAASSAAFSPDGSLLAVLFAATTDQYPHVAFMNWGTGEVIENVTLSGFTTDFLLLTDWTPDL